MSKTIPEAGLQSAVVALGHDGRLLGALGGRDYGASQFNRALTMARPAASTAKVFVYAAAFDAGRKPAPALLDAFATSDNATAEELAREIGVDAVARMARRHGVASPMRSATPKRRARRQLRRRDRATGAMLPYVNAGLAVRAHATFGVWRDGEPVFWRDPAKPAVALTPKVTNEMRPLLRAVVARAPPPAMSAPPCRRRAKPAPATTTRTAGSSDTRRATSWACGSDATTISPSPA
ncbi:MAG: hypothetical protein HZY79_06180 [Rhodoblastus sp.]|nr:MAG: hypothetical protein HZY79_06180 [Rhodoblastus sp.]